MFVKTTKSESAAARDRLRCTCMRNYVWQYDVQLWENGYTHCLILTQHWVNYRVLTQKQQQTKKTSNQHSKTLKWLECLTHDRKVLSLSPGRSGGRSSSPGSVFCARRFAVSCGTSHVPPKQRCKYTTSVDIQNALQKATVTYSESHATRVQ